MLLKIPFLGLLNQITVSNNGFTDVTAHAQLARFVASASLDPEHEWHTFTKVLPKSFESVPLSWQFLDAPVECQIFSMVPACKKHVDRQKAQFLKDYKEAGKGITLELYLWAWLCVNTRCLYVSITSDPVNNLTLAPIIDFLNHTGDSDRASTMEFSQTKGMMIYSGTYYNPGDEIFITYGAHSNSFLLCEYGFVLPNNEHDFIDISHDIPLTPQQLDILDSLGYKGDYTVSASEGPSFRTTISLVAATMTDTETWTTAPRQLKLLTEGLIDETRFLKKTQALLTKILRRKIDEWTKLAASVTDRGDLSVLFQGWITIAEKSLSV